VTEYNHFVLNELLINTWNTDWLYFDIDNFVGFHHTPPELHLGSHCQISWRHASPPSTLVSCRSDSRPCFRPKLEASPRSSQQLMDWPAMQGQQQHATSWPVEKIHHTWSYGSDATVLDEYALTTTTNLVFKA